MPADVIATVMVLQALEGKSDREACRALERDIAWKAAAGLVLTDEAFHPTVLTLWRNKLRASDDPQRIFNPVRVVVDQTGLIAAKNRRVLDSTVLDDAVQRQDTITMLVTQIRRVRKLIPELGPRVGVREHNLEGGRPPCDWDDPADIDRLISELVDDANELVWAAEDLQHEGLVLSEVQADAVALLALVAGQDVEPGDGPGRWRIAHRTAPNRAGPDRVDGRSCRSRVASRPQEPALLPRRLRGPRRRRDRHRDHHRRRAPAGNVGDAEAAPDLLDGEPEGTEVLGDSAYGSGEFRSHLDDHNMSAVIKPPPLRQAVEGGFTLDDFEIDTDAGTVCCPAGVTVTITASRATHFGTNCRACPLRRRCTTAAKGRTIVLHPHHALLAAARVFAATDEFNDPYHRHRPMIERTIAWFVRGPNRKVRYRGIERNRIWLAHRAAAVNLNRLVNLDLTRDQPRLGHHLTRRPAATRPTANGAPTAHADPTHPRDLAAPGRQPTPSALPGDLKEAPCSAVS